MSDDGLAGRTLAGRYDVLSSLGSGGMGEVYRARDRELDEEVALKVIHPERTAHPAALERFRREVKLARRVTHINVARTFELVRTDDITFCTMELVEGESLRQRLSRVHRLPPAEAVAIARELCDGLAAAHAAGVIHRDIKPDNVLIASDGRVVLADFGVAAASLDDAGEVSGTLAYMAPEQARGEPASPATDIYAVAVVLYEMLTGRRAFSGTPDTIVRAKQLTQHLEIEESEHELARIVARATERDPAARIASASELGELLGGLAHTPPPNAPPSEATVGYVVRTVLVLPPKAARGTEHFALALHEEVLAQLGKLPRVRALPRATTIGEEADSIVELGVDNDIIHATIRRPSGSPISLRLPLVVGEIEAAAHAVASAAGGIGIASAPVSPDEATALDLLYRARERLHRGLGGTADTLALLERANTLLPDDPRIIAALAFCEVRVAFFYSESSVDRIHNARALVSAALASGPEGHLVAGHFELHAGNPARAAGHFREAIAGAPHRSEGHEQLGRMLLEAGFVEDGVARLEHALAMSPARSHARWEIARALALQGLWEDTDRIVAELVAEGADRWVQRARFEWWRRDLTALARIRTEGGNLLPGDIAPLVVDLVDTLVDNTWRERRGALVAGALVPTGSKRRRAFTTQLVAEVAGYFGDSETCGTLLEHASTANAYDLLWLDHCPVLIPEATARVREQFERRASAILDAMYGDYERSELAETAVD